MEKVNGLTCGVPIATIEEVVLRVAQDALPLVGPVPRKATMRLKTFRASSMADALAAVKKDLGKDAVILHTRSVKAGGWMGIGSKIVVEVIASDQVNVPAVGGAGRRGGEAAKEPKTQKAQSQPTATTISAAALNAYKAAGRAIETGTPARQTQTAAPMVATTHPAIKEDRRAAEPVAVAAVSGGGEPMVMPVRQRRAADAREAGTLSAGGGGAESFFASGYSTETGRDMPSRAGVNRLTTRVAFDPADAGAAESLYAELAAIKKMVGQVLRATPSPLNTHASIMSGCGGGDGGSGGGALFQQYLAMLEGEVSRELADEIVGKVRDELTPAELVDESIVRVAVLRQLSGLIQVADAPTPPNRAKRGDDGPMVIALVGPTGVGKTTTIAKLAATYKLRHGKRVGLITADTYRIAAVDQLRTYAGIIGLPLKVVLTPEEMAAAREELDHCDVILVDTAGRSPGSTDRLEELRTMLAAASPSQTHLVLSSAASEAVLLKTVEAFGVVGPNRVIFTKLDEAVNFGVLVNVASRVKMKLSFVTTGQEVPDHIEAGRPDRLARLVLDGRLEPEAVGGAVGAAAGGVGGAR